MSAKQRLGRLFLAAGLSVFSLGATFKAAAGPLRIDDLSPSLSPALREAIRKAPQTAPSYHREQNAVERFKSIDALLAARIINPAYDPATDPDVGMHVDAILDLVRDGLDTGYYHEDHGVALLEARGMPLFHAAVVLSITLSRPDIVATFLEYGASATQKAPDNWSPMDYALDNFVYAQKKNGAGVETSANIIGQLRRHGAIFKDAQEFQKFNGDKIKTYADMIANLSAAHALLKMDIISPEQYRDMVTMKPALTDTINATTDITTDFFKAHGAVLPEFSDLLPQTDRAYPMPPGETFEGAAERLYIIMGLPSPQEALKAILRTNTIPQLPDGRPIRAPKEEETLQIPLPPETRFAHTMVLYTGMTLMALAENVQPIYYNQTMSIEQIARDIARLNDIDQNLISDPDILTTGTIIDLALARTDLQTDIMPPPPHYKGGRNVDLIVLERGYGLDSVEHSRYTFEIAAKIAHTMNPGVDMTQIHAMREVLPEFPEKEMSDALRMTLLSGDSPVRNRHVFSFSMANSGGRDNMNRNRSISDHESTEHNDVRLFLPELDKHRPVIFAASGNFWIGDGRYIQSYQAIHSPRTVLIGAVGKYKTYDTGETVAMVAPYSSYGADVCAQLPKLLDEQMEGTSFSTPLAAALYRQFAEWYGDALSHEEIVAAALMSADRNFYDELIGAGPLIKAGAVPAAFTTNGGGIPHHERCGTGVIEEERWRAALDMLVSLKDPAATPDEAVTHTLAIDTTSVKTITRGNQPPEYVYTATIPAAMTLGRTTFIAPHFKTKPPEIIVRTPAGFEMRLPWALTSVISSLAFAYEDVKEGATIELRTTEKLAPGAEIMLRGHAPGNAIAALRDRLHEQGVLPKPGVLMAGNTVTGPAPRLKLPPPPAPLPPLEPPNMMLKFIRDLGLPMP